MILPGLLDLGFFNLILPVLGIIGCILAGACSTGHARREVGYAGAALAVIGSSIPGFFGIGIFGLIFSVAGLILLVLQLSKQQR